MSRWFRVYDDLIDDPKVQRLPADLFRALVNLWCLASKGNGVLPPLHDVAYKLRVSPARAAKIISELCEAGLIDAGENGQKPHNWHGRQYKSDVSTNRVKRFRERQRNVAVTAPDTDTESETEQKEKKRAPSGAAIPQGWMPSVEDYEWGTAQGYQHEWMQAQTETMRRWAEANANRAVARKLSWSKTWRNWLEREHAKRPQQRLNSFQQAVKDHIEEVDSRHERTSEIGNGRRTIRGASGERHPVELHAEATGLRGHVEASDESIGGATEGYCEPDG